MSTQVGSFVLYPRCIFCVQGLFDVAVPSPPLRPLFLEGVPWDLDGRGFVQYLQKLGHFVCFCCYFN